MLALMLIAYENTYARRNEWLNLQVAAVAVQQQKQRLRRSVKSEREKVSIKNKKTEKFFTSFQLADATTKKSRYERKLLPQMKQLNCET